MMDAGDVRGDDGASETVQRKVLYMFWATIFGAVALALFAGFVLVFNLWRAGFVPNFGGIANAIDPTQAMLALAAVGYVVWKVVSIMLVATFGVRDVQAGSDVAKETADEVQDGSDTAESEG